MPHYLVVLRRIGNRTPSDDVVLRHEGFIDEMVEANVVLLGGSLSGGIDADAAYLVRTGSIERAEQWARKDPLVTSRAFGQELVEWELVGVNLRALDASLVVGEHSRDDG